MPSSNTLTYDQATPHRPGVDDVGGAAKVNARQPADPVRAPVAEDFNQMSKQLVEIAGVSPIAILVIKFSGGLGVESVTGMGAAAKNPLTYNVTSFGAGQTRVTWAAGIFPPRVARHTAVCVDSSQGQISTVTGVNKAEVYTADSGGGAADHDFVLYIMGQ